MTAAPTALPNLRVVDLSSSVAGQFCGRLFADNGAEVVLVEPADGSPLRRAEPLVFLADGERWSALLWHLNLGKRGLVVDDPRVAGLIAAADVVIVDDDRELAPTAAATQVVVRVVPFGADSPLADWRGGELVYQALSGTMHENGRPDREPLYGVGHRASYAAGTHAYVEALAEVLAAAPGRHAVEVAVAEVAASMNFSRVAHYSYNGSVLGRDARETQRAVVKVGDGWLGLFVNAARWEATCRSLGVGDLITDPRFAEHETRRQNWPLFGPLLEERLTDRRVDDLVEAGQAARAVVARSMPLLELRTSPQLVGRGFWRDADAAELPQLGPMFDLASTPQRTGRHAPALGEGASADLAWGPRAQADAAAEATAPLGGIRVLDLTSAWAGPMAARLLGALGADVLKVEGPGRIDDWRGSATGGDTDRYPDHDPGERPYDRHFQYNTQNQDKRGIVVDLKNPDGRDLVLRLAETSDVVMANFSSGTLDRLGIGWEDLRARNPRIVLLEMPAYGSSGPMAHYIAYGPSMELMAGIAGIIGYGDGRPVVTGPAYNDPIGGLHGAAAVVTALVARRTLGAGQRVEVPQRDASMHWIGEEIVAALARGSEPPQRGNSRADLAPHGAYRASGDDEWIAVAAADDEEFARLWSVVGGDPALVPELATVEARRSRAAVVDAAIARWAAGRDKQAAAEELQRHGVTAAPVLNARDLAASRYLAARGAVQRITHREAGTHLYPILPVHLDGVTHRVGRAAPCFGEHNEAVLRGELGLSADEYDRLIADAVIADVPTAARSAVRS